MNIAQYIRLYADEEGESHFEDQAIDLVPVDFGPPAEPINHLQFLPVQQSFWLGAEMGWGGETPHPSPRRQILCTVLGEYAVTASDGSRRSFPAGTVLLAEDTWGKGHSTTVTNEAGFLIFGVSLAED
jgi:hypothetical protein